MTPAPQAPAAPGEEGPLGLASLHVRPGHPDFLDLPWDAPLLAWRQRRDRIVEVPRGISRHEGLFVEHPQGLYAVKELPAHLGEREYDALRWLEERGLPAVVPAGHARVNGGAGQGSVLVTRFLEASLHLDLQIMEELHCQVLEHKWFLSEKAGRDVGLVYTLEDFFRKFHPPGK
jgi:hypothetical protein